MLLDNEINIVKIDEMPQESLDRALNYIRETHSKRPYTKPIAIHFDNGRHIISVGKITTMTSHEVAEDFKQKLITGDKQAIEFNRLLCEGGQGGQLSEGVQLNK